MMRHVKAVWFERVAHRVPSGKTLSLSHTLVVVTDLLTDLDVFDMDALDYLESEIRRVHPEANDIRFIPVGRESRQASRCGLPTDD
jgi:hypothetical protein